MFCTCSTFPIYFLKIQWEIYHKCFYIKQISHFNIFEISQRAKGLQTIKYKQYSLVKGNFGK